MKKHTPKFHYSITEQSGFELENWMKRELVRLGIPFVYERSFHLANSKAPTFRPDFILLHKKKRGKTVLLEPHCIWSTNEKRSYEIGNRNYFLWMPKPVQDPNEEMMTQKLLAFKEQYGDRYYLILFVPSRYITWVKTQYGYLCDEMHTVEEIPGFLGQLCN